MTEQEERFLTARFAKAWPPNAEYEDARVGYIEILEWIGTVWFTADEGGYSGDIVAVLWKQRRDGENWRTVWGLASIGYGSCSGCDALQAARDDGREETLDLVKRIANDVRWFDNLLDIANFIDNETGQWWSDGLESRQVSAVIRAFCAVKVRP